MINGLKEIMEGKEILILVPGNTLNTHKEIICKYIAEKNPIVISVNFISDKPLSYAFFGNQKRYARLKAHRLCRNVIISSNIKSDTESDMVINYHSVINRGYKYFENSTIMLLNLLKRINPGKITIAGFDGFREESDKNYSDKSFQNERHVNEFATLNKEITAMLQEIVETMYPSCLLELITPSLYEKAINNHPIA